MRDGSRRYYAGRGTAYVGGVRAAGAWQLLEQYAAAVPDRDHILELIPRPADLGRSADTAAIAHDGPQP